MELISAFLYPSFIVFAGVLSIPVSLFWRRKRTSGIDKGYPFIIWGASVIALGTGVAYALDVVLGLNSSSRRLFAYTVEFDMMLALVFYLPGCVLVGVGLSIWLPAIQRLSGEISLREETERQLIQAKTDAEVANAAKSQFLANMSHELRTPLNAILGFSDILKNQSFGSIGQPIYQEYAEDINASGKHLLDVINDILDVAKIEAGRLRLKEEIVNVKEAVEVCFNMLSLMADEAKVVVNVSVAENLPHLYVDEVRLRQIVSNLLSNAIKFTNPKGTVTVLAGLNEAGGMFISIADTGIGIAEEDIENALSQFGQVTDKYARNKSGTGLGLPLVQLITAEHGGSFEFSSKLGVGTNAVIHFPAERLRPQSSPCSPQSPAINNWARKAI